MQGAITFSMRYLQHNTPTVGQFAIVTGATPVPGPEEVLLRVIATALNRADLLQVSGHYPPPAGASEILGLDVAGIVVATGEKVTDFAVGDPVCTLLSGGGYAQYAVADAQMLLRIPAGMSFTNAAALPEVFLTAWQALVTIADVQAGEMVLVHAGASGVGTAALQLCQQLGARCIATASAPKHDTLVGLGADRCIDYRAGSFVEAVREWSAGAGVQLVLDFVGASYWQQNLQVLAADGRMVCLGLLGGSKLREESMLPILQKRLTITGTTLRSRSLAYRRKLVADFRAQAWPHFANGTLRPVIDSIYDWEAVAEAHAYMAANANTGKIVLTIGGE